MKRAFLAFPAAPNVPSSKAVEVAYSAKGLFQDSPTSSPASLAKPEIAPNTGSVTFLNPSAPALPSLVVGSKVNFSAIACSAASISSLVAPGLSPSVKPAILLGIYPAIGSVVESTASPIDLGISNPSLIYPAALSRVLGPLGGCTYSIEGGI